MRARKTLTMTAAGRLARGLGRPRPVLLFLAAVNAALMLLLLSAGEGEAPRTRAGSLFLTTAPKSGPPRVHVALTTRSRAGGQLRRGGGGGGGDDDPAAARDAGTCDIAAPSRLPAGESTAHPRLRTRRQRRQNSIYLDLCYYHNTKTEFRRPPSLPCLPHAYLQ